MADDSKRLHDLRVLSPNRPDVLGPQHTLDGRRPGATRPVMKAFLTTNDRRLATVDDSMEAVEIHPGAWHLRGCLTLAEQRQALDRCRQIAEGPVGFYVPTVRGSRKMSVEMLCLGLHWNALTYTYEPVRSDYDGQPVPLLTSDLADLARRAAAVVGMSLEPQVCIVNRYGPASRLGLHQDKDEREETIWPFSGATASSTSENSHLGKVLIVRAEL